MAARHAAERTLRCAGNPCFKQTPGCGGRAQQLQWRPLRWGLQLDVEGW